MLARAGFAPTGTPMKLRANLPADVLAVARVPVIYATGQAQAPRVPARAICIRACRAGRTSGDRPESFVLRSVSPTTANSNIGPETIANDDRRPSSNRQ